MPENIKKKIKKRPPGHRRGHEVLIAYNKGPFKAQK